jgi:uncharacterized protein YidB (DUF937 family)
MSIINQILGALTGGSAKAGAGATSSPIAGVVEQLLGAQAGGQGLNGLVQKFEAAGLANVVQSWISTGANLPIKPEQLQQALGAEHLTQLAQTAGLNKDQLLQQLSKALPGVIDGVTPGGKMPSADMLGSLLGKFTGKSA